MTVERVGLHRYMPPQILNDKPALEVFIAMCRERLADEYPGVYEVQAFMHRGSLEIQITQKWWQRLLRRPVRYRLLPVVAIIAEGFVEVQP